MTFDDALRPLSLQTFVENYLGMRYLLVKAGVPRFRHLVDWHAINSALRHMRFSPRRLRLVQNGRTIPDAAYTFVADDANDGSSLDARRFESLLAAGATLNINKVDELFPAVQAFAESCEEHFRISVDVNLYAGWRTDNGFDLHWDRHDTVILQIVGRKQWTIYEPTMEHPLDDRLITPPPRPSGQPVWSGMLEEGDFLYMPRGWWHVARPLDEPTLHVTAALRHRTAATLLRWLGAELNKTAAFRADLPVLSTTTAKAAYAADIRTLLATALTDDVVERYMRMVESQIPARPRMRLPYVDSRTPDRLDHDVQVRLTTGQRLHLEPRQDGRTAAFTVGEIDFTCDSALVGALQKLRGSRGTTLIEMEAVVDSTHRSALRSFIAVMLARGAIWVEQPVTALFAAPAGNPQKEHSHMSMAIARPVS